MCYKMCASMTSESQVDNRAVTKKLFVFAAGGSGMRVVETLTILAASGYLDDSQYVRHGTW